MSIIGDVTSGKPLPQSTPVSEAKPEFKNYYKNPAGPVKPNPDGDWRAVSIASDGEVPDDVLETFGAILKFLRERSFTVSLVPDEKDMLVAKTLNSACKTFIAKPHKFFNEDVKATLDFASNCAHESASWILGTTKQGTNRFQTLPDFVRAIISARTNTLIGKKCDQKVKLCIIYSEEGAETRKDQDFKLPRRNTGSVLEIAEKFSIPVFNLGKKGSKERLMEYFKAMFPAEESKAEAPKVETPTTSEAPAPEVTEEPATEQPPQAPQEPQEEETVVF